MTSTTTAAAPLNPLAAALSPFERTCWALAGAIDSRLERSPLRVLRVSFDPLAPLPWWHIAALADAGGWEVQAGRWVLSADRPRSR